MWHIVFDNYGVRILISKTISLICVNVIVAELMSHASLLINFDLASKVSIRVQYSYFVFRSLLNQIPADFHVTSYYVGRSRLLGLRKIAILL